MVRKVPRLVQGYGASPSAPNYDLWTQIAETLGLLGARFLGIHKVDSHCDHQATEDEVLRWMYYNNKLADEAAGQANCQRPAAFWECWDSVRKDTALQELITSKVQEAHVEIAVAARTLKRYAGTGFDLESERVPVCPAMQVPTVPEHRLRKMFSKYGRAYVLTLVSWFRLVSNGEEARDTEPKWISLVQLYIAFKLMTGVFPPFYRAESKQLYAVREGHVTALREVTLARRVTWFQSQTKEVVQAIGGKLQCRATKPFSEMLQVRLACSFIFHVLQLRSLHDFRAGPCG